MAERTALGPVRVLIVAPSAIYREGLVALLATSPRLQVIGAEPDIVSIAARHDLTGLDVVILDVAHPAGLGMAREIRRTAAAVKLVAVNVPRQEDVIIACAQAGVLGYLVPDDSVTDLLRTIHGAARGEAWCPPLVAAALVGHVAGLASGRAGDMTLTPREHEILTYLSEGLSNKEIARRLSIETATVKNHIHNLLQKLHVHGRGEAAALSRLSSARI